MSGLVDTVAYTRLPTLLPQGTSWGTGLYIWSRDGNSDVATSVAMGLDMLDMLKRLSIAFMYPREGSAEGKMKPLEHMKESGGVPPVGGLAESLEGLVADDSNRGIALGPEHPLPANHLAVGREGLFLSLPVTHEGGIFFAKSLVTACTVRPLESIVEIRWFQVMDSAVGQFNSGPVGIRKQEILAEPLLVDSLAPIEGQAFCRGPGASALTALQFLPKGAWYRVRIGWNKRKGPLLRTWLAKRTASSSWHVQVSQDQAGVGDRRFMSNDE
ncbi:hypothetical protein BDK51DRAFT_30968 [Blyttiomyces helicus]|uniref:Uncharacterized protein n=1 Tax=Blyttiomyces helicus TaxID=388810 RepID=A0A4P9WQD9_9FUNG|nr:hypothetical protein BDK51DRAFT_30968 [Blyttiomyces helicus]|eukprot:RKO94812.1 hypothetical protein BDK51DRAFT_30968 [Blyttiomyces helicus]